MKLKLTLLSLLALSITLCAQSAKTANVYKDIISKTDAIYEDLVKVRRDLHIHPEISKHEKRTSQIVATYLRNLGLEVKTNVGGYGVVGILKGGKKGRTIAWRADMDAIKTDEADVVDFKSKNKGVRHICGHDVHTTIGLGIANVLSQHKADLEGTVYFIFQPAEETASGAKAMIADGLFENMKPDEIYGLHIGPEPSGTINYKANELFAYQRALKITFKPSANEKELEQFMTTVLNSFARNIEFTPNGSPWNLISKIGDPEIGVAAKETIFKDYFILQAARFNAGKETTVYSASFLETSIEKAERLPSEIKSKILNSKFKDAFVSIDYLKQDLTPINDPKLTRLSAEILGNTHKKGMVKPLYGQIPFFGEDFIYFQEQVPGVFFFLGAANSEKGIVSMPHTPNFEVDETTIKYGVKAFATLIFTRTNSITIFN